MIYYLTAYVAVSAALLLGVRRAAPAALALTAAAILVKSALFGLLPAATGAVSRAALAAPVEELVRGWLGAGFSQPPAQLALATAVLFAAVENSPLLTEIAQAPDLERFSSVMAVYQAADGSPLVFAAYLLQPFARIAIHAALCLASIQAFRAANWAMLAGVITTHAAFNAAITHLQLHDHDLGAGLLFSATGFAAFAAYLMLAAPRPED